MFRHRIRPSLAYSNDRNSRKEKPAPRFASISEEAQAAALIFC
jgi:hypothetical protein